MNETTRLSGGAIGDQPLSIDLVEPANDLPNAVVIKWPAKPTIASPANYDQLAAAAMRLLANASVELAAIKVRKKL
jgi:hypothetical protein